MHSSIWDIQKSLNYFEAPIWCAFRSSGTNKLIPSMLLIIFPKLLEILMAVMNQIPQQLLVHKTKLGKEKFSLLICTAFPCLSHIFQEILVIIWIIKAKPVTAWGRSHQPPVPIRSHNTKSKLVKGYWRGLGPLGFLLFWVCLFFFFKF